METKRPKISVLIICYNQEILIRRAIESLLSQAAYIYEICISDDNSTDNTWNVITEYAKNFPDLFKIHRNIPNLGIFKNIEYTWKMPTGDLIYQLSGDDECGLDWLKTVSNFVIDNSLDFKNSSFCIYGDYQAIYPNGDSFISSNRHITNGHDPVGLAMRKLICSRSVCFSRNVLKRFIEVSDGRSYAVESAQDMQIQIMSDTNYYIPMVGNKYHTGIGVSVSQNRKDSDIEHLTPMEYLKKVLDTADHKLSRYDQKLYNYYNTRAHHKKNASSTEVTSFFTKVTHTCYLKALYFCSIDPSLGIYNFKLKRYLFAIFRRIPHKKPIRWYI